MKITKTPIEGLLIIEPQIFKDARGYFFESYNEAKFKEAGVELNFVQDNQSLSQTGAVRGLHFQAPPFEQGKLVRVVQGAVMDVVVDIRKGSPTYGQNFSIELSAENQLMFFIPPGFAHGFETLLDQTIFLYKCTNVYNKGSEGGLLWNDPELGINWQTQEPIVSEKDLILPLLKDFTSPF
ncbi:MAG: dTDP-4-dehydrorhamnose 3,5-epimerase [Bacteroidia bacterium]|nr:dTDP-4-dehydrorhamnose 3,5-epimerase [Bacteroidia bacterium]MCF8425096.1 dTDP-4-dehydrorhamnose 3,5-epimerase [Bacteroidia bacterium]MCF8446629.1 dTDP-4-dehydrorhamnose 3,5-epimerase [Bacteroidia bacterium]